MTSMGPAHQQSAFSIGATARPLIPVAALLALTIGASRAQAQHCGSYVSQPGDAALAASLGLSTTLLADLDTDDPSPDLPVPNRPCHGPSCSKGPLPSPTPSPTSEPPSVEQWAATLEGPRTAGSDPAPLPSSEGPHGPGRPSVGVFHPPRHA